MKAHEYNTLEQISYEEILCDGAASTNECPPEEAFSRQQELVQWVTCTSHAPARGFGYFIPAKHTEIKDTAYV
eukprot:6356080-Amphidinium_carterae.1